MAYVVARKDGRYEIRESRATPDGPRSRTLATFRSLTPEVLAQARSRAMARLDEARIRARAAELGAPSTAMSGAAAARQLLRSLRAGESLPPALVRALRDALPPEPGFYPDTLDGALEWVDQDDAARGKALYQLVEFGNFLPRRRRGDLTFPRIESGDVL